jgi:hypothetical protein
VTFGDSNTTVDPFFSLLEIVEASSVTQINNLVNAISAASDSQISNPQTGQILAYNASQKWQNQSIVALNSSFARLTRVGPGVQTVNNTVVDVNFAN